MLYDRWQQGKRRQNWFQRLHILVTNLWVAKKTKTSFQPKTSLLRDNNSCGLRCEVIKVLLIPSSLCVNGAVASGNGDESVVAKRQHSAMAPYPPTS